MTSLFPELDEDRQARNTPPDLPEDQADPDLGLDRGPDRLLQRRLPSAGFVRLVENPTPTFELPPQRPRNTWGACATCGRFGPIWFYQCADCYVPFSGPRFS